MSHVATPARMAPTASPTTRMRRATDRGSLLGPTSGIVSGRLPVGLGDLRGAAACDDAVATFVEHLRDGSLRLLAVPRAVEADTHTAGGQVRTVSLHPPRAPPAL